MKRNFSAAANEESNTNDDLSRTFAGIKMAESNPIKADD
jgi:hypothetical protein